MIKGYMLEDYRYPRWTLPVAVSLAIHLLVGLLILLAPVQKKESDTPFITRLVSPDEFKQPPRETIRGHKDSSPPDKLKGVDRGGRQKPLTKSSPPPSSTAGPVAPLEEGPPALTAPTPESGRGDLNAGDRGVEARQEVKGGPPAIGSQKSGVQRKGVTNAPMPLREKLFDREIVERFAKREDVRRDDGITFETKELKYYTYMMRLKERIEGIWKYPNEAASRGIYGDLYIRFTIKKNGMLGDTELVRTSGHRSLDEAAMKALKDAEPFWPLPDEWGKDAITITGHFVYSLYGTYIR